MVIILFMACDKVMMFSRTFYLKQNMDYLGYNIRNRLLLIPFRQYIMNVKHLLYRRPVFIHFHAQMNDFLCDSIFY